MVLRFFKSMQQNAYHVPIPRNGVDYRNKVVLAPMVRSGELPSRLLALSYGADLVWGPETIDKSMIGTTRKFNEAASTIDFTRFSSNHAHGKSNQESVIFRIDAKQERQKLIFQLGTASADTAVEAGRLVAPDVAGIDVNAGCPKPFSTSGGMGAALLKDPDRLAAILTALVQQVGCEHEIGISVKIRLLEDVEDTKALVYRLCKTGITGLTVHCRTTPMRPREPAIRHQLAAIGQICSAAGVACLINGDVRDREEALSLAKQYSIDGGMIATAAEKNPSCFRTRAEGGLLPWLEVAQQYMIFALKVQNRWGNTKFLLAQIIPGKTEQGKHLSQCKTYHQICEMLDMPQHLEMATIIDAKLGLHADKETKSQRKHRQQKSCRMRP